MLQLIVAIITILPVVIPGLIVLATIQHINLHPEYAAQDVREITRMVRKLLKAMK